MRLLSVHWTITINSTTQTLPLLVLMATFAKPVRADSYFMAFLSPEQIYRSIPAGTVRRGKIARRH